jgi:hypothetical protein
MSIRITRGAQIFQKSRHQKGAMKQVPYRGPTSKTFSCPDDLAPRDLCTPTYNYTRLLCSDVLTGLVCLGNFQNPHNLDGYQRETLTMAYRLNWLSITTGNGGWDQFQIRDAVSTAKPQTLHVNTFLVDIKWLHVVARDVTVRSQVRRTGPLLESKSLSELVEWTNGHSRGPTRR